MKVQPFWLNILVGQKGIGLTYIALAIVKPYVRQNHILYTNPLQWGEAALVERLTRTTPDPISMFLKLVLSQQRCNSQHTAVGVGID